MYTLLCRLRFRWYVEATGRLLMRHWQWFVIAGLFVPMDTPLLSLLHFLALPLTEMFVTGHNLFWHLVHVGLIQVVTLTWVMLQRSPISGNDFMRYAATLPISTTLRRCVDLTMLFLANSILLLPMVVAASFTLFLPGNLNSAFHFTALVILLALVLVTQLAALEKNTWAWFGILLGDVMFSAGLMLPLGFAVWILLFLTLVSLASSLIQRPAKILLVIVAQANSTRPLFACPGLHWISSALRIQAKALIINHPGSTTLRIGAALSLAAAAGVLIRIFQFDARTLPTAIIAMAVIALILSGIYRTLQSVHVPMRSYLGTLPVGQYYWAIRDTFFVMLLGIAPLAVLLLPLFTHGSSPFFTLAVLALLYQVLLVLLRFPLIFGGRQAVLVGVILAGIWSGAVMAAVQ